MNRLARGLVGGIASGLLICLAMLLGFIGGIHSAVGGGFQTLQPDVVPGVVVSVDDTEDRVTVRYTPMSSSPVEGDGPWTSLDPLPSPGDSVQVEYLPGLADAPSSIDPVGTATGGPGMLRESGRVLLVMAATCAGLGLLGIVATVVWVRRAPPTPPPPRYPPPTYLPPGYPPPYQGGPPVHLQPGHPPQSGHPPRPGHAPHQGPQA